MSLYGYSRYHKFLAVDFTHPSFWEAPDCHEYVVASGKLLKRGSGANCVL